MLTSYAPHSVGVVVLLWNGTISESLWVCFYLFLPLCSFLRNPLHFSCVIVDEVSVQYDLHRVVLNVSHAMSNDILPTW